MYYENFSELSSQLLYRSGFLAELNGPTDIPCILITA